MAEKKLLLGDEAIALGAIHAGISGVYAYPGTPSTEITEFIQNNPLAKERKLPALGVPMKKRPWRLHWVCHTQENVLWYV